VTTFAQVIVLVLVLGEKSLLTSLHTGRLTRAAAARCPLSVNYVRKACSQTTADQINEDLMRHNLTGSAGKIAPISPDVPCGPLRNHAVTSKVIPGE